ncbi:helix-turn-helix domain-containing protein [Microbispora rosea]|uniref:helix-turn-helix domain-containing protein n=1 Tax=Microbispora rosea TaxID=58117 RepID=UPI000561139D|nr:helix-turn-helix transcriptional regulator [Microbispora rosea]
MTRTTRDTHEKEHRSLGTLIRAWRERALLTQEQLADLAGVNVRTIGRLEGDAVGRPRSASLQRLAETLGLDAWERAALAAAARRMPARRGAAQACPGIPRRGAPAHEAAPPGRAQSGTGLTERVSVPGDSTVAGESDHRLVRRLPEACLLVDLSGRPEPDEVLRHLLRTLRLPHMETSNPGGWGRLYRTVLTGHRLLIVLADAAAVRVEPACRCGARRDIPC